MCGLLAVFEPHGSVQEKARNALHLLRHRGPDAQALWMSDDQSLALGHARLKILDLSDSANQPMHSPDGRYTLIFNGEIVNFRELRQRYRGPWTFRTNGDTEVLLATFAQRGVAAMHDWVGMFAFVLLDRERGILHLVRDRFGIKPLYWTQLQGGGIAVASEIPPLLTLLPRAIADEDTIRTYLETGHYETGAHTFFAGIQAIEPGCAAEFNLATGELTQTRWYRLADHVSDLSAASEHDLIERGAHLVETAILDHLIADVRVGLNVSGGVDSSVLVNVAKTAISDLHVFTQDHEEPYSELEWVRKVSDGATLHRCALTSQDIRAVLDDTVKAQAEPFGGVMVCGYDRIYREADNQNITVLLDGNGVDEVFLGYTKYLNLEKGGPRPLGMAIDGTWETAPDAVAARMRDNAALLPLPEHGFGSDEPARELAAADLLATKIPRGLRFNDRVSMRRSKELRVPFLDHRLVEFGFGVPVRHLLNADGTKALFRKIATHWIPEHVANAKKRSIQSPQREWLADEWRDLVWGIIRSDSFRQRGWIDAQRAAKLYENYLAGNRSNSFFIWQWLNLEMWARAYLD